jgi:DNA ligase-associated metallophosphoesterase
MNACEFSLAGARLMALGSGALHWPDQSLLCVSDLHFGKSGRIARQGGAALPPYETRDTLERLSTDLDRTSARTVVCLGDSFDDLDAAAALPEEDRLWIARLQAGRRWIWIEGNHDPKPPADLGGRSANELRLGALVFRHEPTAGPAPGEIAGHLHPCARIDGRGGSVRTRCFASDGQRLIMPAYGTLTGGLNILDPAFAPLFPDGVVAGVLGRDSVYVATGDRLRPDATRASA